MTEQMAERKREQEWGQELPQPLRAAASVLRHVPGAGTVGRVAEGALDKVGAVSPRGRRIAVYTGAGVLGVAGVVEWPVAITGAAVAWLTQPRGEETGERETGERATAARAGTAEGETGARAVTHRTSGPSGPPTPQVLAESAPGAVTPDSPSDKLPTHRTAASTAEDQR
ncbi:hypothetical protein [Streptomyces lincolnensis]|uniref:hypothetical protein n=1 Tax=Streptomyces lincolnensis TaxID=1915 RepID=UPI001E4EA034|nr:hypothetical protein [Streptomyces lincolnensis]